MSYINCAIHNIGICEYLYFYIFPYKDKEVISKVITSGGRNGRERFRWLVEHLFIHSFP